MDAPTVFGAVNDSDAVDVSLEQGQKDYHATFTRQEENCQDAVYHKNQSHKQTQTEMYTLSSKGNAMNLGKFNIHRKTRRDIAAIIN